MDTLFSTLYAKTFFVLAVQLFMTWLSAKLTLLKFRQYLDEGATWISATTNEKGQTDMHVSKEAIRSGFSALSLFSLGAFFLLYFWGQHQPLWTALAVFSLWSTLIGVQLAIALISVDENLGANVLAITVSVVLITAMIAPFGLNMAVFGNYLLVGLIALILFNLIRIFIAIPRNVQRFAALIGVALFTVYLIYDFHTLSRLQSQGINDWNTATNMAIELYLDVINLFLELLDAMSD
ncbi:Bax inhibitor-1 family protein [Asticcacaulis machinosus]|uniref:Bax inhibitor-1 family protein n=1 Tax=Asticcacaulis machinosus TaxID=2984211 RepID=A0ABT5HNY7_9CAUL|nr:Bax inhibitor-1 family protein [Asticcacaulis machinosus]MDC7677738.1 Bax inhibitor-1 family protein [Asticcacaulis machinosus]